MTWFSAATVLVAVFSGATASVAGFGIGSLLTPLLSLRYDTRLAVAAVTIPHALATGFQCWRLRAHIDRPALIRFGLLSASGTLAGAMLFRQLAPANLTRVLGALLLLTALAQLTGWSSRRRPHGPLVAVLGLCSGFFGGVVGNQGELRAAALTACRPRVLSGPPRQSVWWWISRALLSTSGASATGCRCLVGVRAWGSPSRSNLHRDIGSIWQ